MAEYFSHDRQGNFGRRGGTKVKADGRGNAGNFRFSKACSGQTLDTLGMVLSRAESADIEALGAAGELQRLVVDMADVGKRGNGGVRIELQFRQGILRPVGDQLDAGETRLGGKGGTRIDDNRTQPEFVRYAWRR